MLFDHCFPSVFLALCPNSPRNSVPTYYLYNIVWPDPFLLTFCTAPTIRASNIKDALEEHLKDISHNEESESIKLDKEKAEKDQPLDSLVKDIHSNHYSKANDDTKYLKKDQETKGIQEGHQKQGFQNSYHKDESSNKSTFFDDFNDEGDQAGYNSKLNKHDNNGERSYEGSHNNGQEYLRNNFQGGGSNKYGDIGNKHANYQDYGKKYYVDNSENYNKYRNGHGSYDRGKIHDRHHYQAPPVHQDFDWQDWNHRRDWERPGWDRSRGWETDYGGPGYYDDHGIRHDGGYGYGPNHGYGYRYGESRAEPVAEVPVNTPVVAQRKQTITIYEDPRYSSSEKGQMRREQGDYIELDFQPSSHRYASYDDTYYSLPSREKSAESSKINKLVYNYRRQ
ncbi:unnamed protein product, partial [Brenthis ino]